MKSKKHYSKTGKSNCREPANLIDARHRLGGRPQKLDSDKLQAARSLLEKGRSMQEVAEILSVHRATLYRGLRRR